MDNLETQATLSTRKRTRMQSIMDKTRETGNIEHT